MICITKYSGYDTCGVRLLFKGSGGSSQENYKNLEALYGEQTASARLLRQQAEANLPSMVNSYVGEVNQVTDPGYADNQAAMAGADMASANAMERSATNRELQSMGVNPNDARFVGANRATETNNAARMAAGKNIARNDANKYQLAVAQDAVGTFTGQSNSAASQMGGATSGLSSLYNSQNAAKQAAANQSANNTAAAVGGGLALMSLFKDGGKVTGRGMKRVERHMLGGAAGSQQKNAGFFNMETVAAPQSFQQPQQQSNPAAAGIQTYKQISGAAKAGKSIVGKLQARGAGANMTPSEAKAAADAYDSAAANAASKSDAATYKDMAEKIRSGNISEWGVGAEQAGAPVTEAAITPVSEVGTAAAETVGTEAAGTAAAETAGTVAAETAATAVGDAALTTAATEAGAAAAGSAAATGAGAAAGAGAATGAAAGVGTLGATLGAAMPWVGAAMAVGSLLELWADGGEVGTQREMTDEEASAAFSRAFNNGEVNDITAGGRVPGVWTENKDTVPALLVEGEGVLNSEAMALGGEKVMEELNAKGLELREQGITPHQIRKGYGMRRKNKESA